MRVFDHSMHTSEPNQSIFYLNLESLSLPHATSVTNSLPCLEPTISQLRLPSCHDQQIGKHYRDRALEPCPFGRWEFMRLAPLRCSLIIHLLHLW